MVISPGVRRVHSLVLVTALLGAVGLISAPRADAGSQAWFRSVCDQSHALRDDPIMFPRSPGAAHLHDFFGNRTTNAYSTYASLRLGRTTCDRAANRAAYWVPSVHVDGRKIRPQVLMAYYRAGNKRPGTIMAPPPNLRVISHDAFWRCTFTLGVLDATRGCRFGHLEMVVRFPDCWDGRRHDSADHRSHLASSVRRGVTSYCPATHPVPLPRLEYIVNYGRVTKPFRLSSGAPGTAHADFVNSWDQPALARLVRRCINGGLASGLTC